MKIYIYAKQNDDIRGLKSVLRYLNETGEIAIISESTRSFNEYQHLKKSLKRSDILVVWGIFSLALSQSLVASELKFFIDNKILLFIYDLTPTYKDGANTAVNMAVLQTLYTLAKNEKISLSALDKNYSVGRNKLIFPQNWSELYEKWQNKEITSKEFISASGLKKATFYNMLCEYENLLQEQVKYQKLA
ncbi:hypothetical protein [Campylobacter showae]|jgi:possible resolvase|uniref:hypothetical protein n=1 Tax=Campylobacter showae TaxID=204 RepID=UPI003C6F2D6E